MATPITKHKDQNMAKNRCTRNLHWGQVNCVNVLQKGISVVVVSDIGGISLCMKLIVKDTIIFKTLQTVDLQDMIDQKCFNPFMIY